MSRIHLTEQTTATPEQFLAALTDFGPGRSAVFGNSQAQNLHVHQVAATNADVTEGTGKIWERLYYDWSDPRHVVVTVKDSNTWSGASRYEYTLTPGPDGKTVVDVVNVRDGKTAKGRVIGLVAGTVGRGVFAKSLRQTLDAVEARNRTTPTTQP
jgi:hypothetical protein